MCFYCPTNLDIDQFQDSTEVLPILGVLDWVFFPFGISRFCKNLIIVVPIFLWAR